jgi:hypothetical protein
MFKKWAESKDSVIQDKINYQLIINLFKPDTNKE